VDILNKLSPRKKEIAELVSNGLKRKAIAQQLNLSFYTVQRHLNSLYRKLGVANVIELKKFLLLEKSGRPPEIFPAKERYPKRVLSPRLYEAARLRCNNKSNEEVAEAMGIKKQVAKNYVHEACEKLGVVDLQELAELMAEENVGENEMALQLA